MFLALLYKFFSARRQFTLFGQHIYYTRAPMLAVNVRAMTTRAFLAHAVSIFLTKINPRTIRMSVTLIHSYNNLYLLMEALQGVAKTAKRSWTPLFKSF